MRIRVPTHIRLFDVNLDAWSVTAGGEVLNGEGGKYSVEELTTAIQELDARVAEIKAFHARVLRMAEAAKAQSS